MSEIESAAIGKGRKSVGNLTYRYVNGKTIASQRITTNKSKTALQVKHRNGFAAAIQLAKALTSVIEIGYEKIQRGTKQNNFMCHNKDYMEYVKTGSGYDAGLPAITNLCVALNDPDFKGKVAVSSGNVNLAPVYGWGVDEFIEAQLYLARDFAAGDRISLVVCYSFQLAGSHFEIVRVHTKELTEEEVDDLVVKNQYKITGETFPGVNLLDCLPPGYTDLQLAVSVIVSGEKDRSSSYFFAMPAI